MSEILDIFHIFHTPALGIRVRWPDAGIALGKICVPIWATECLWQNLGEPSMWKILGEYQTLLTTSRVDVIAKFLPVDSNRKTGGEQLHLPGWNHFLTDT